MVSLVTRRPAVSISKTGMPPTSIRMSKRVSCCARDVGHNSPILFAKAIKQTRLPDVWTPTIATLEPSCKKRPALKLSANSEILLRVESKTSNSSVNSAGGRSSSTNSSEDSRTTITLIRSFLNLSSCRRQLATDLSRRLLCRSCGLRRDQISNCFGLRQVNFAI
jgi:hypothetical protein